MSNTKHHTIKPKDNELSNLEWVTPKAEKQVHRTVVRVTTNCYSDGESYTFKKTIRRLKRKSEGYNQLEGVVELCDENVCITNLLDVSDGVYELVTCNHYKDYETGYIEDWDWMLVPHLEENKYE